MNNNEEERKVVYNIPGVIIPPQRTENGVLITTAIDDSKEAIENGKVVESTPSIINNNPIPEEVKQITPESIPPQVDKTPTQGALAEEVPTIPKTLENPSTKEPFKPPEEAPKESKKKKNKQPIYILIILLLALGLGYFIYTDFINKEEIVDPVKELQRKRAANVNSLIVKELYSYVDLDGCDSQIDFFYNSNYNIGLTSLTDENKNYLAYRQLKHSALEKKTCGNYQAALHKNDQVGLWYCGDEYLSLNTTDNYNDESALTYVINESDIKLQVERMFGISSYHAKSFSIGTTARYLYNERTESYIYQSFYGTNSCKGYSNKLDSAYTEGENIHIIVKVTDNESKKIQMFNYTFTESEDANYYFTSLVKKDV